MATTITNQASLRFTYGGTTATASSNIASTVMQGPLTASKSALESAYRAGSELTYIITLNNSGATTLTGVTITDDLGTYAVTPATRVTPLLYTGPAHLYINGAFSAALTPETGVNGIEFTIPSLAACANAILIYKVRIGGDAPLTVGAEITNTAVVSAANLAEPLTVSETVPVGEYADVSILKAMSPNPVTDGGILTYTFTIQNYGNTAATDVVLSDNFSPVPDPITVTVDGAVLSPADYDYVNGLLTLPGAASAYSLSIPAATFVRDATTGAGTINPGVVTIVVTGTI